MVTKNLKSSERFGETSVFSKNLSVFSNNLRLLLKERRFLYFTKKGPIETNEDIENGFCHLKFQNKLKCIYDDDKKKEMIINENNLIIFQKRNDKKYYYPVSKSMFKQILNKEELISLINKSEIELKNNEINLINYDNNEFRSDFDFQQTNFL